MGNPKLEGGSVKRMHASSTTYAGSLIPKRGPGSAVGSGPDGAASTELAKTVRIKANEKDTRRCGWRLQLDGTVEDHLPQSITQCFKAFGKTLASANYGGSYADVTRALTIKLMRLKTRKQYIAESMGRLHGHNLRPGIQQASATHISGATHGGKFPQGVGGVGGGPEEAETGELAKRARVKAMMAEILNCMRPTIEQKSITHDSGGTHGGELPQPAGSGEGGGPEEAETGELAKRARVKAMMAEILNCMLVDCGNADLIEGLWLVDEFGVVRMEV
ncbi:hypothetical protein BC829DRAFT_486550 [Chytridium lagenaria]|nr:hypothetical protein BC829DRAFT_486550 [Chytridium lagenaria]